jgi:hypothetical protein
LKFIFTNLLALRMNLYFNKIIYEDIKPNNETVYKGSINKLSEQKNPNNKSNATDKSKPIHKVKSCGEFMKFQWPWII